MRVFFDTNVLTAAFTARGKYYELFDYCSLNHEIILSQWILDELGNTLLNLFSFPEDKVKKITDIISERITLVDYVPLESSVCRNPDDENILATALSAEADCIVTGDKVYLSLKEFRDIPILSPGDFWDYEKSKQEMEK